MRLSKLVFVLIFVLGLVMALGLACGDDDDDDDDDNDDDDDGGDDDDNDDDDDGGGDDDDDSGGDDDGGDDEPNYDDLVWQNPPSDAVFTHAEAAPHCDNLVLDGYDDWRLPTINELRSIIRGCESTELGGECGVADDCTGHHSDCFDWDTCATCDYLTGPGPGGAYWPADFSGEIGTYWSSTALAETDIDSWCVDYSDGAVHYGEIEYDGHTYSVRCVRP